MNWLVEVVIIALLILTNALLAMAEIAVVSSRKTLLKKRARDGSHSASIALELAENPDRFLSTVQIGITLVGITAGAYGGVTLADKVAWLLRNLPFADAYADFVAMLLVVGGITFLSIIVGELVPKRIALRSPESVAMLVARPLAFLTRLARPAVWLLAESSSLVLRLMRLEGGKETPPSEEEVSCLMDEGTSAGVFHKAERHMVEGVLRLDERPVTEIMTHRSQLVWLDLNAPDEVNWRKIVTSGHSHFPVYQGSNDNVIGIVGVKALWANMAAGVPGNIRENLMKPIFVPGTISAVQVLDIFRKTRMQRALVADEFGGVQGMVSLFDVMTAIVGEMPETIPGTKPRVIRREDGNWEVDGALSVAELHKQFALPKLPDEDEANYITLGGFLANRFGRIPEEGSSYEWGGWVFEVAASDHRSVGKVLMKQAMPKDLP
jgi:putative hemolysin